MVEHPDNSTSIDNIVHLNQWREQLAIDQERIIRMSPENDGLCMLYSNASSNSKLYRMNILCWALNNKGEVHAMVPWLNRLCSSWSLQDPLEGQCEGFYDPTSNTIFNSPPQHKVAELETAARFFEENQNIGTNILQEIPDTIGTHALLSHTHGLRPGRLENLMLTEVVSWRLFKDGSISAMLIDQSKITQTPILPGDDCLFRADSCEDFRYFFQHRIANQIKAKNPDALAAMAALIDG